MDYHNEMNIGIIVTLLGQFSEGLQPFLSARKLVLNICHLIGLAAYRSQEGD